MLTQAIRIVLLCWTLAARNTGLFMFHPGTGSTPKEVGHIPARNNSQHPWFFLVSWVLTRPLLLTGGAALPSEAKEISTKTDHLRATNHLLALLEVYLLVPVASNRYPGTLEAVHPQTARLRALFCAEARTWVSAEAGDVQAESPWRRPG